ncbi:hypothetical protein ACFY5C_05025 [Streptomyces sp. NPDC012935]|uniref:hypothetical protein n=1 Tax=Streptomyces sp. NPDC012935 TaxID=3364857 RepID=UPI0036A40FCB
MNTITALVQGWAVEGAAFVRHVLPWQSACCVLLIVGVTKFLSETSRRKTLLAITTQAPPGTVVAQEAGMGGPKMLIQVGGGAGSLPERDS